MIKIATWMLDEMMPAIKKADSNDAVIFCWKK
jgi:hypothetical protein